MAVREIGTRVKFVDPNEILDGITDNPGEWIYVASGRLMHFIESGGGSIRQKFMWNGQR